MLAALDTLPLRLRAPPAAPSPGDRWAGWVGVALSLLLHLGLLFGWARLQPAPAPEPPMAPRAGDPGAARLEVWLLQGEPAPAQERSVPPMPLPPERAARAPVQAAPTVAVATANVLPLAPPPPAQDTPAPLAASAPADPAPGPDRPAQPPTQPAPPGQQVQDAPAAHAAVVRPASGAARRQQQRYLQDLMAWLARHRTYPDAAKKAKLQGVVHVRFTLDRQGRLLASAVDRGPGIALLERAAMDVLQRASPMPPIPESMGISKLTLTLPIEYSLLTD